MGTQKVPDALTRQLVEYIDRAARLDPFEDAGEIRALFDRARGLIDRNEHRKKWIGVHGVFATFLKGDSDAVIAAHTEVTEALAPEDDPDRWAHSHAEIGLQRMIGAHESDQDLERSIRHLELAVQRMSYVARPLGYLYGLRIQGDRLENWQRRIRYTNQALDQALTEGDRDLQVKLRNELGKALAEEPDGDFAARMEERIALHNDAFAALSAHDGDLWIETLIELSESFNFRVLGDHGENLSQAEAYARSALAACNDSTAGETRRRAYHALAHVLVLRGARGGDDVRETLVLLEKVAATLDPATSPEVAANVQLSRANVLLRLVRAGEVDRLPDVVASTEAGCTLLGQRLPGVRRSLNSIEAQARIAAGDFTGALAPLDRALTIGQQQLAQSRSIGGRMETVRGMGRLAALKCHCHCERGELDEALVALERGKGLFWQVDNDGAPAAGAAQFVPRGGALLFACLAADEGRVIAVTETDTRAIALPGFGNGRLMELQRGSPQAGRLGGWLYDYARRNSDAQRWHRCIESIGETLYKEVWRPVLGALEDMGVSAGAELVWFHQGGSSILPFHLAWRRDGGQRRWLIDDFALRFAPSVGALAGAQAPGHDGAVVLVNDPTETLVADALEAAWMAAIWSSPALVVLGPGDATRSAVIEQLAQARIAHFATHASFDFENPWRSSLLLTTGESLSLKDCYEAVHDRAPALVVLSACETAMTKVTSTPDEFLGFPSAFLYAGTRSVLATLWPVDDLAAALIVGRFYQAFADGVGAGEALRRAQRWLRRATARELLATLRPVLRQAWPAAQVAARVSRRLSEFPADERPYRAPAYWGAFTLSGHGDGDRSAAGRR